jgi:hypothetical protein
VPQIAGKACNYQGFSFVTNEVLYMHECYKDWSLLGKSYILAGFYRVTI